MKSTIDAPEPASRAILLCLLAMLIVGVGLLAWGWHGSRDIEERYRQHAIPIPCRDDLYARTTAPDGSTVYFDRQGQLRQAHETCLLAPPPSARAMINLSAVSFLLGIMLTTCALFTAAWGRREIYAAIARTRPPRTTTK